MRAIIVCALLAGCGASLHGQAEAAFEREDYLVAAELFGKLAVSGDAEAIAKRDVSRDGALAQLKQAYAAAPNPQAALVVLTELLAHRDAWQRSIDVTAEVARTGAYVTDQISTRIASAGPLAAEALEHGYAPLLGRADFRDRHVALDGMIVNGGRDRCAALAPPTPYLTWVVDRYCAHFGVERGDAQPLPGLRRDLAVTTAIAGATDAQETDLARALAGAFHDSIWFAPGAPVVAGHVSGRVGQTVETHPVELTKNWTETVSYQEDEQVQEAYDESYQDLVGEWVTVPCYEEGCTPSTSYQTHFETKTRTAYRWVTQSVTKYRDEPRVFTFTADQVTASNTDELTLVTPIAAAELADDYQQIAYNHDVTFAPAGVAPSHTAITELPTVVASGQEKLRQRFAAALAQSWVDHYCADAAAPEAAAQCFYGERAHAPAAAHAGLATVLGGDEPFLAAVLASGS